MLWQQYAKSKPDAIALKISVKQQDESGKEPRFSIVENSWTWHTLNQLITQQSVAWQQQGVQKGNGLALIGRYQQATVIGYLSALQLGCRVLVINPMFPQHKIAQICEQNDINYVVDCSCNLVNEQQLLAITPCDTNPIAVEQADWLCDCPLTLTLTSGSTGLPKAVVHTLAQHVASARGITPLLNIDCHSEWLLSLPLFHVSGQGILWRWLVNGAVLRCVGESVYQDLTHVTHASLVPTQLQRWLNLLDEQQIKEYRLSYILLGGAHIPTTLTQRAKQYGIECYSGYGMTEMASTVFAKISDNSDGVGFLLPEREYRLQAHEVWVKGAVLALGYWQKGKGIRSLLNAQGWFATRDRATIDPLTGELFILGRLDNMFISGGENIQPEEIEALMLKQTNVRQAIVLPIDDLEFGQRPVALVEFLNGFSTQNVTNLAQMLQQQLEKFKCPIAYYPLEKIQSTQTGIKLSRHLLAQQLTEFLSLKSEVENE